MGVFPSSLSEGKLRIFMLYFVFVFGFIPLYVNDKRLKSPRVEIDLLVCSGRVSRQWSSVQQKGYMGQGEVNYAIRCKCRYLFYEPCDQVGVLCALVHDRREALEIK